MSTVKRLGKDQRNKFIKEFEQDGKLSDPGYYALKDKNGKIQIRRTKTSRLPVDHEPEQVQPAPEDSPPAKEQKEKTL